MSGLNNRCRLAATLDTRHSAAEITPPAAGFRRARGGGPAGYPRGDAFAVGLILSRAAW